VSYPHEDLVEFHIVAPVQKQKEALKLRAKLGCQASVTPYRSYTIDSILSKKRVSYIAIIKNNDNVIVDLNKYNESYNKMHVKPILEELDGNLYISCLAYQYAAYQAESKSFDRNLDFLKEQMLKHEEKDNQNKTKGSE
jgi:hypothetical protein